MRVTLRSGAKINLGLAIGPVRPDGFHSLVTVYQTLHLADDACDLVSVELEERRATAQVTLTTNDLRVPVDERNTVVKILSAALAAAGRGHLAAKAHLEKRLPVQGGLGAGSANAAVALLGLERLLARSELAEPLDPAERLRLAAAVGSDVPLFLLGGAVLGSERGEQVSPLPDLEPAATEPAGRGLLEVLVAVPEAGVSTPEAFRAWDAGVAARALTPAAETGRLERLSRALAAAWCEPYASGVTATGGDLAGTLLSTLVQAGILQNDFESVVFRQHPFLEQIKHVLAGGNSAPAAIYAALSGSGSALFGVYPGAAEAEQAEYRLKRQQVRTTRAQLAGRRRYWGGLVYDED